MEPNEWTEIITWLDERFPRGWTPDQAVAFFADLSDYAAEDVWDALYRIYDRGIAYPPTGSELKKETTLVVRDRIQRARDEARGLNPGDLEDGSWKTWGPKLGWEGSLDEAVKSRHAALYPKGCPFSECDVHHNIMV